MDAPRKTAAMVVFFLVAFGVPWAVWISLAVLHVATPENTFTFMVGGAFCSVGGVTAAYVENGASGVGEIARRCVLYRVSIFWWAYALFSPLALLACASVIYGMAHGKVGPIRPTQLFKEWWLFFMFGVVLFQGPLSEELGWRGFLLPSLLEKYSPLKASVIVGIVAAAWHIPIAALHGWSHYPITEALLFAASEVAVSILVTALFLRTYGSILLAIAMHWSIIPSSETVRISFPPEQLAPDWLRGLVVIATALVVAALMGSGRFESKTKCRKSSLR